MSELEDYLIPTDIIDCNNEMILANARELTKGCASPVEKALKLFTFVRDDNAIATLFIPPAIQPSCLF